MAENQTTSVMGSRKIADKMNEIFENQGRLNSSGKQFKISKSTICKYLNKELRKPRKLRKVFALNEKNKMRRIEYCQKLINDKIIGKNIFFTDETTIMCISYVKNEQIRLLREKN